MKVITTIQEMQTEMSQLKAQGKSIGFVPTMGFLHEGHMMLIRKARQENSIVAVSVFVNPLQFGPGEDYDTYPRDFARDRALAESVQADYLFYPDVKEMYPDYADIPSVTVVAHRRTKVLCGKSRPGHFDGVVTVLTKLFNIIMPARAYFGMKDAQQVAVVDGLIKDFNFPIQLVAVDIVREPDGLAKSSRNVKLTPVERQESVKLYECLQTAKQMIVNGERNPANIIEYVRQMIETETSGQIDYVEIYSYPQLKPLDTLTGRLILALAVKFSAVRLIDNITLEIE